MENDKTRLSAAEESEMGEEMNSKTWIASDCGGDELCEENFMRCLARVDRIGRPPDSVNPSVLEGAIPALCRTFDGSWRIADDVT